MHDEWRETALGDRRGFGPLHAAAFRHEHRTTAAGVVERIRGVSHVAVLDDDGRDAVLERVRRLLADHPDTRGRDELRVPYRVDCYWTERL